jgi:hypothetical protein
MYFTKQLITEFTSSNLTSLYPEWNPSTTYSFEATSPTSASIARVGAWYYRSLSSGNLNFNPVENEGTKWIKWQVANTHAMLDSRSQTKSTLTGANISVTFNIGFTWDSIGVGQFDGRNATIELLDAADLVVATYETSSSYSQNVSSWYTWTFEPRLYETNKNIAIKIDKYLGATQCRVTINAYTVDGDTDCGFLVGGISQYMGKTLIPLNFDYSSYTQRTTDAFGNTNIVRRPIEDKISFQTAIDRNVFMTKQREIKQDLDSLVMFAIDDIERESRVVLYGMMSNPTLLYDQFEVSILNWKIQELN